MDVLTLKCWAYVDDLTCVIDEHHAVAWLAVLESACAREQACGLNVQKDADLPTHFNVNP